MCPLGRNKRWIHASARIWTQIDTFILSINNLNTGWNDKIVALEKTTWFHFRLMKTGFFFVVVDHLLVGQLCRNPKSDRNLLSCMKVTQCSTSEIGDAPLYNSYSLPIQVKTTGPLPAPSKCNFGLLRITGTGPGWWKQSFRLRLWSLVWFQVRTTSCHPGYGSMTRRRPTSPKRPRLGFRRSATTLYPSLTGPLLPRHEPAELLRLVIRRLHHQYDLPQYQS